jgi:RNA polymerase sigma-70 factor, ECF subfamily
MHNHGTDATNLGGIAMRPEKQSERVPNATRSNYSREQAVIELARKGDANAFEQLYTAHKGRVYSLCVRMTRGNTSLAEDLTQEVFIQVYRKIQSFRGESAFSSWLHRVTVNAVLMRLRKPVVPEVSLEELQPEQEDAAPKVDFGSYDLRLEGVIDRARLERAIDRLAEGYHTIFVLHDIYGYDHKEIAEILGCSIGNSKSQAIEQNPDKPSRWGRLAQAGHQLCSLRT